MSIKVNNDTANGSVEIKAPNVAGDYAVTTPNRNCTIAGEDIVLGVNQTWQDVTASRTLGTTYTNTTGKPIMVIVSNTYTSGSSISLTIGGVLFYNKGTQAGVSLIASSDFIVPNGVTYSITMGNTAISKWMELR